MTEDYTEEAVRLSYGDDEALYAAIERDARRYNKAFTEEEEALGE